MGNWGEGKKERKTEQHLIVFNKYLLRLAASTALDTQLLLFPKHMVLLAIMYFYVYLFSIVCVAYYHKNPTNTAVLSVWLAALSPALKAAATM